MPEEQAPRSQRPWPVVVGVLGVIAALVALAAILDLGPFGGDSGTLTREQFIAKGDALCKTAHEQFASLQPTAPNTAQEAAVLTGKLLTISEDEYNGIKDLAVPAELTPVVDRYLEARLQGIDLIRDAYDAAKADDPKTYHRDLVKVSKTQVQRLKLAKDVGFSECSVPIAALTAASSQQ